MKSNKIAWIFFLFCAFIQPLYAQEKIALWPDGKMINSKGKKLDWIESRERVTQVDKPFMYAYFTSKEENKNSAVLIFPPGGYQKLTYNVAGIQLAKWFNTIGINAFVVMNRLPTSPDLKEPCYGALQDAQRAMKIVRSQAAEWEIDPKKIGVMGCSAGGGVAANVATIRQDVSSIGDSLDAVSHVPNFQILISAVISMGEYGHKGSKEALLGEHPTDEKIHFFSSELQVTPDTPKAFIVHANDDPVVNPINSVMYYQALRKKNVDAALFIFPHGGHSIALRNNPLTTNHWTNLCESWLKEMGFL